jgi:SEC-C motif-containing protein
MMNRNCYCQSNKSFETCCQLFLSGSSLPRNPEQLMRSRFSAFCTENIEYLLATHHPSMRQADEAEALLKTIKQTQWIGLKILKAVKPKPEGIEAYVEFVAFYQVNNIEQLHENSRFIRDNNQWYYLDGQILGPIKFSRNEPCWCGSQKKYKKCHG